VAVKETAQITQASEEAQE